MLLGAISRLEVLTVLRQHHSFLYRRACEVLLADQDLDGGGAVMGIRQCARYKLCYVDVAICGSGISGIGTRTARTKNRTELVE